MSSACKFCLLLLLGLSAASAEPLRVCADPNNMPYSNAQQQGFENRLASMIAADMGTTIAYVWHPFASEYVRRMLKVGVCDAVMALPSQMGIADRTEPYYRSAYVFVSRSDRQYVLHTFDDPQLRSLRIGVNTTEDAGLPPTVAMRRRGLSASLVGFNIFGSPLAPDPQASLIRAVANGTVDVAAMWGPLAGYYAQRSNVPLRITEIASSNADEQVQLSYSICIGVRRGNAELRDRLNTWIVQHQGAIRDLLVSYGVPLFNAGTATAQNR